MLTKRKRPKRALKPRTAIGNKGKRKNGRTKRTT